MSTFHPFPRLPSELRIAIWELTFEPREVEVRIVIPSHSDPRVPKWSTPSDWYFITSTKFNEAMSHVPTSTRAGRKARRKAREIWTEYHPYVHLTPSTIPAILHICRETRNLGIGWYQQVYLDGEDPLQSGRRYVWLNLEVDLVNIGSWNLAYFTPLAPSIKRLKLRHELPEEFGYRLDDIKLFVNVEELQVVCVDVFSHFGDEEVDGIRWPCAHEKLVFIDEDPSPIISESGRIQVGYHQLKQLHRKYWRTLNSAYGTEY